MSVTFITKDSGKIWILTYCVSVLYVLFVLGDLKTKAKILCLHTFFSEENSDMGCTLSELHDFTIVLNIRNIYSYANVITVFLYELTHVIQKPHLGHGFHEFVLTNAHLVSCLYYLIEH